MKASPTYLLEALSNNDVTFFIPPYQRNYEWSIDNCKVFFGDVRRVADQNTSRVESEHFFGSIVYVVESSGFGMPDRYILTDGQQRITTTMLFLMALRDSIADDSYRQEIQRRFLQNERAGSDTDFKIKLKQVETDWEAYKALALEIEVPAGLQHSTVYLNYTYFLRALGNLEQEQRKQLLEFGLSRFQIIGIQLEPDRNPWEHPQEIFESMNSLGKPLSLADLVRNFLLMGQSSGDQSELYAKYWLNLERLLPGKLSGFIRDWMQSDQHRSYKIATDPNYKELYAGFKDLAGSRDARTIFSAFSEFSVPYSWASGTAKSGVNAIDAILNDLHIIGVGPVHSYLAEILHAWSANKLSESATVEVLKSIRIYILRRRILALSGAENKFFPTLGAKISLIIDSENVTQTVFSQLSNAEYALRLPNDNELRSRLLTMNFYNVGVSRSYPRLLLSMVEEHWTKSRPIWDDSNLQLEHIMPQSLSEIWRDSLGPTADEIHGSLVNNIGNITLIRHNQELGNRPFAQKKEAYAEKSGLQVAQNYVLDCEVWDATAIQRRAEMLADLLVNEVLAIPAAFRHSSNWRQVTEGGSSFDARNVLNQLIGERIEFASNPNITAEVVSASKVLFEDRVWSLGPLTKELKQREGSISPTSSFHGASNWTWENTRIVDLEL